jgi:hypothetical protein
VLAGTQLLVLVGLQKSMRDNRRPKQRIPMGRSSALRCPAMLVRCKRQPSYPGTFVEALEWIGAAVRETGTTPAEEYAADEAVADEKMVGAGEAEEEDRMGTAATGSTTLDEPEDERIGAAARALAAGLRAGGAILPADDVKSEAVDDSADERMSLGGGARRFSGGRATGAGPEDKIGAGAAADGAAVERIVAAGADEVWEEVPGGCSGRFCSSNSGTTRRRRANSDVSRAELGTSEKVRVPLMNQFETWTVFRPQSSASCFFCCSLLMAG